MLRALYVLLPAFALLAQNPPDALDVLTGAGATLFTAKTVRIAGTQSMGFIGFQTPRPNPFKMEFVRGGRGRAEWRAGNTLVTLMVFDGTNFWEYHDFANQYTKRPATIWNYQGELGTLDYGRNRANIAAAAFENDETIDFGGRPVDCRVIRADYSGAPNNRGAKGTVRRVWISKDAGLIIRDYWEGALSPGMENPKLASTTNYTAIETDVPLPDDLFVFQPPPGSKLGEPMVPGGVTAMAPPPPPPAPVRNLEKRVDPEYSDEARAAGLQGSVILSLEIAPDGQTKNLQLIHGLGMGLDQKAIDAVRQWRYTAIPNSGVRFHRVVEVPFRLKPADPWVFDGSIYGIEPSGARVEQLTKPELLRYSAPDSALCTAQGYVGATFHIASNGAPSAIRVTGAPADNVRDGVQKAIESWRFRPATEDGSKRPGNARIILECRPADFSPVQGEVYRGSDMVAPAPLFRMEPEYSEEARKAKIEGVIGLTLIVEPDGKVSDIRIVRTLGMGLEEQAIGTVMQWRFKPGTRGSQPIRVFAQISVSFRLL